MTFASTANPAIGTRGPDLGLGGGVWSGASRDTQGHTYYLVVGCLVSCVSPRRIPSGCERASRAPLELETRAPELFFLRKVETRTSLAHSQCRVVALGNWYEALLRTHRSGPQVPVTWGITELAYSPSQVPISHRQATGYHHMHVICPFFTLFGVSRVLFPCLAQELVRGARVGSRR